MADRLTDRLGPGQVFMDVDTMEPGADFATVIARALAACRILIALIGPTWLTGTSRWRLDDPGDFVAMEIRAALERGIPVIPVLVDGAVMPERGELPEGLQGLAGRNAVRLDHDTFRSDLATLLAAVDRLLSAPAHEAIAPARDAGTAGAGPAVTAGPRPHQQAAEPGHPKVLPARQQEVTGARARSLPTSPPAPLAPTPWSRFRPPRIAAVIVLAVVGGSVLLPTDTRSVTATIPVGDYPSGVAVSPDGRHAYITNRDSGSVSVIDIECRLISCWFTG
ncbi:MAG: TIR domain-containing protein [Pseudonocardiales bacterium]